LGWEKERKQKSGRRGTGLIFGKNEKNLRKGFGGKREPVEPKQQFWERRGILKGNKRRGRWQKKGEIARSACRGEGDKKTGKLDAGVEHGKKSRVEERGRLLKRRKRVT